MQANFFMQFPIQGRFHRLILLHATLRKLPAFAAPATAQKYAAIGMHQQNADIAAKSVGIDLISHSHTLYPASGCVTRLLGLVWLCPRPL